MNLSSLLLSFLLTANFFQAAPTVPTIRVLVLDPVDGAPMPGVHVNYVCNDRPHLQPKPVVTGEKGIAEIPYTCHANNTMEMWTYSADGKRGCGGTIAETVGRIEATGIVSNPGSSAGMMCSTRVSRKMKPTPGEVVLFVKKPNWWQSHVSD